MPIQNQWFKPIMNWRIWAPPVVMAVLLVIIAQYNFLAFHTLVEIFAIVISFVMFALAWFIYDFSKNSFLIFLACGYFWVGSLDLMHTLVYKGMNVIVEDKGNLATQFWIGTRYSEALLLLAAPFAATRKQNKYLLFTVFGMIAVGLATFIVSGKFPNAFIDGKGLTDFKIYSEYIINLILVLAVITLIRQSQIISIEEKAFIVVSITMTICAELAFTFYVSVYGLSNLTGHIFKVFSFWMIFQAIVISNLKKPYSALRESELRYHNLFEFANDSIFIIDANIRKFVEVNQNALRKLGYKRDELLGLGVDDLYPPEYSIEIPKIMKVMEENGSVIFQSEHVRKDGVHIPVEVSSRVIHSNGDKYYQSIVRDITIRKKQEDELRQRSHDLGERIKELTGLYAVSKIFGRKGVGINEGMVEMVEAIPPAWHYPEITCARIVYGNEVFSTGNFKETVWTQESDITVDGKHEGKVQVCYLEQMPALDEGPFLKEERQLINDIASRLGQVIERKRAFEALSQNEEKFRSIYQSSNVVAIVSIDEEGNVSTWNPGAAKAFGYSESEIIGQPLICLIPERYRQAHRTGLKRVLETGEYRVIGKTVELHGLHKDGHEFPLELSLGIWQSGQKTYFSAVINDITERKEAERNLIQAKEEAEAANKTKTEFLANMSHELRTPLNAIIGFSDMIKGAMVGPLENQYQEYGGDIHTAAEHLLEIISDVLDISRIERGNIELEEEELCVSGIVDVCMKMVSTRAVESGVALTVSVSRGLPSIYADPLRLKQILLNLLSNAIKFTPEGGNILLMAETDRDGSLWITVSDTGIGIAQEDIPRVSESFSQIREGYTHSHEGSGLGLAIAKSLMELHGGALEIESKVGEGTTVTITFPPIRILGTNLPSGQIDKKR